MFASLYFVNARVPYSGPETRTDRLLKALKHLTKTPRVYSRTPSLTNPTAAGGWIVSEQAVRDN
jgi:hypothetical protein